MQEALTSTARHASVAGVSVRLWIEDRSPNLQVKDRGRRFDPDVVMKVARSSGLFGMSERITLVGGHIPIDSASDADATITIGLPLNGG
jgi:signal transduction histidine kinase